MNKDINSNVRTFEISANLNGENGVNNFELFKSHSALVFYLFNQKFGKKRMKKFDLLLDNATKGSGHTPIITPVLNKYLIIKLNIIDGNEKDKIVYQLAHELGHYIFYTYYGLEKIKASNEEEAICTAISLLAIRELVPERFDYYMDYVSKLDDPRYKYGPKLLRNLNYNWTRLEKEITYLYNYK